MLKMLAQNRRQVCLGYAKRIILTLGVMALLAIAVAAACTRETISIGYHDYGGERYNEFVSCGSSAGNFGYSCDSNGRCYEDPTIDASQYCHCDGGGGGGEIAQRPVYPYFIPLFQPRSGAATLYVSRTSLPWPLLFSPEMRGATFREAAKLP